MVLVHLVLPHKRAPFLIVDLQNSNI